MRAARKIFFVLDFLVCFLAFLSQVSTLDDYTIHIYLSVLQTVTTPLTVTDKSFFFTPPFLFLLSRDDEYIPDDEERGCASWTAG